MSMKYSLRRKGKAFGTPVSLTAALQEMRERLKLAGGPYSIKRPGQPYGPLKNRLSVMTTLAWNLPKAQPEDVWRVKARAGTSDPVVFSVRAVEVADPIPDTAGTPAIDQIHAATVAFCLARGWNVTELGICANKEGQHNKCNAWDANAGGFTSDEIHRRLLTVGNFLKDEGTKHLNSGGKEGLPVLGVIVMEQFWKREESTRGWQTYTGTAHVSHWHVSGFPSMWPGWI